MSKNDIESAFPTHGSMGVCVQQGMSLRDYIAIKAMEGLIAQGTELHVQTEKGILIVPARQGIPPLAYEYADAMLKARDA